MSIGMNGGGRPGTGLPLSPRETQVAILTAEGLSVKELAGSLGIGEGTVRNLRQSIRRKLGVAAGGDLLTELVALYGAPGGVEAVPTAPRRGVERRVHLTLRQAITEVEELTRRLEARSEAMRQAAERSRVSQRELQWEADQLRQLADDLARVHIESIARARGLSTPPPATAP